MPIPVLGANLSLGSSNLADVCMIKPFEKPVYVTRPFLPPLEEFCEGLREIWANAWLTNNGPLVQRYTRQLCHYFQTENICLFNNGTLALQIGLEGMGIGGEVITTPFSFVATTHALFWNKLRPVFVDIEPDYYTLDPEKVEAAITPWTTAILAVHVFGYPCRLHALADIARRRNLRLIYDAAHAFGVTVGNRSIAHFGDLSMFSFHATKLYHSIEGGLLTFQDSGLKTTFDYLKNFGFKNEVEVVTPGTNAKMNEMQALMGLQVLRYFDEIIAKRRRISELYRERLKDIPGHPHLPAVAIRYPVELRLYAHRGRGEGIRVQPRWVVPEARRIQRPRATLLLPDHSRFRLLPGHRHQGSAYCCAARGQPDPDAPDPRRPGPAKR